MAETSTIDTRDTRGVTRLPTHEVDATRVEGVYAEGKGLKSTFLEGHDPSDGDIQDAVDAHFEAGAEEVRVDHVVVANTTFSEEGDEHEDVITRDEYEDTTDASDVEDATEATPVDEPVGDLDAQTSVDEGEQEPQPPQPGTEGEYPPGIQQPGTEDEEDDQLGG